MKVLEEIKKYCLSRYNLSVLGAQVGIYVLLVSIWSLVIMLLEHDVKAAKESMCVNAFVLFLLLIVFMANFYVLVPYLFEAKNKIKHWAFWVINLLFIVLWIVTVLTEKDYLTVIFCDRYVDKRWFIGTYTMLKGILNRC